MKAVGFLVSGVVQGVSFRYFVHRNAERLGLSGWVRNLPDGRVEGLAEGRAEAVDALLEAVRRGPPAARVDDVAVEEVAASGLRGFAIRR